MSPVIRFRAISLIEGISYVLLLGIAMPLKYAAGMPAVVTHAGRIHGALFVLFVLALAHVSSTQKWPGRASATAFIAALLPFGAFWLERAFRRGQFPATMRSL